MGRGLILKMEGRSDYVLQEGRGLMISFQAALLRLVLALVLGALVGLERERGERAAGIRTHALVALGSCLVMIVSTFGFADVLGIPAVVLDPSRVAAQVVSGIGFLGAGTILLRKEIIKGLTTAAAIWVVAAIGLACGGGLFLEALAATLLTMLVLVVLRPVRKFLRRPATRHILHIETVPAEESLVLRLCKICEEAGVSIQNMRVQTGRGREYIENDTETTEIAFLTRAVSELRKEPEVQLVQLTLRRADLNGLGLAPAPLRPFAYALGRRRR